MGVLFKVAKEQNPKMEFFNRIDNIQAKLDTIPQIKEINDIINETQAIQDKKKSADFDAKKVPPISIIGAGPAGLFLGQFLQAKGIKYTIYEHRKKADACRRFNGVQFRNEHGYQLLTAFEKLLPKVIIDKILGEAKPYGGDSDNPDLKKGKFYICVGRLQEILSEGLSINYGRKAPELDGVVFDCSGGSSKKGQDIEGDIETKIHTHHSWYVKFDDKETEEDLTFNGHKHGFFSPSRLEWTKDSRKENPDYRCAILFLDEIIKKRDEIIKKRKADDEKTRDLKSLYEKIVKGEKISITTAIGHDLRADDPSENRAKFINVHSYPLITTPGLSHPNHEQQFNLGDSLCRPHPYAAMGMVGVLKTVMAAADWVEGIGRGGNPDTNSKALNLSLLRIGLSQLATLYVTKDEVSKRTMKT
tara:strand:- start:37 stop:1287 length:1251 start_codon:yes stop_codon:yes gene_type:complete